MFLEETALADNKKNRILEFPKINILEHQIEQVNEFIRQRKVFFSRNLNREKIEVFFNDDTGLKKVKTSIWTVSEKAIILKNTTVVPYSDIVAVA